MDLTNPLALVSPGVHGSVLTVLARAGQPLTGRGVAQLVRPTASVSGVQNVLDSLVAGGLVLRTTAGRAQLHSLNRSHLSASAVVDLVEVKHRLIEKLKDLAASWTVPARGLWLFGSVARGESGRQSDLDVMAVRADKVSEDDAAWRDQLTQLPAQVLAWTGNGCEVIELSETEMGERASRGERLLADIRRDAVVLAGDSPREMGIGRVMRTGQARR